MKKSFSFSPNPPTPPFFKGGSKYGTAKNQEFIMLFQKKKEFLKFPCFINGSPL